jgi:hypothetical protein
MNPEMLKIYTVRITPRLGYITKILIAQRFGIRVQLTSDREEFGVFQGAKLNYSKESLWDCPQIKPANLLYEKRMQNQDIPVKISDGIPLFYGDSGNQLGFDPFAASFYFLSRYEEYLPFRKDSHGRFHSESSILSQYDALRLPLVDLYAERLIVWLLKFFPRLEVIRNQYKMEVTFDVDQLFMFKAKGIARSLLGIAKNLVTDRSKLSARLESIFGNRKDPIDIYDKLIERCHNAKLKPIYFFQVGEQSRYDINNPTHLPRVRNKINQIAVSSELGIHPSYYTSEKLDLLDLECERLRSVSSNTIVRSRQHYLRFRLPSTYRALEQHGIDHDYSMGFPDSNGFRASTSHPFKFYDLEREEETFLTIHPMVFMDLVSVRNCKSLSACIEEAAHLRDLVKQVNGVFNTAWHPETLAGYEVPFPSMEVLDSILVKIND